MPHIFGFILDFRVNNVGIEGAEILGDFIFRMTNIRNLTLKMSECNLGAKGV